MNVNKLSGNDNELERKQFVGQRQKLLFEMESELAEELFPRLSGEPLNRFPPSGFAEHGALSHIAMPLA